MKEPGDDIAALLEADKQVDDLKVSRVTFEIVVAGRRRVFTFLRKAKIIDLFADGQAIGGFLKGLATVDDSVVPDAKREEVEEPLEGGEDQRILAVTPKRLTITNALDDSGKEVIAIKIDGVPDLDALHFVFEPNVARGIANAILDRVLKSN